MTKTSAPGGEHQLEIMSPQLVDSTTSHVMLALTAGIRLHHGKFAFLSRHISRLQSAAKTADIPIPCAEDLTKMLQATIDHNSMSDNVHARLMITRGDKKTPSQHPANLVSGPNVVIIAEHKRADPTAAAGGLTLLTSTIRRPPPDTLDQRLNCHSKLHEVIALIQAVKAGADEALMLDPHGCVATCNATNFFIVASGTVITSTGVSPLQSALYLHHSLHMDVLSCIQTWCPDQQCLCMHALFLDVKVEFTAWGLPAAGMYNLHGITREVVLEVAEGAGIPTAARPFPLCDVYGADEAFVTGTFGGLTPVAQVDGRSIGTGQVPGPMTKHLQALYAEAVSADVASSWV